MPRPRQHSDQTREALLEAAERLAIDRGLDAIGVRAAATAAGTTTRAVYTLFGSREELVQALAERAFELLVAQVDAVPLTGDPERDLVESSVRGFRRFVLDHPQLYRLFFAGDRPAWSLSANSRAAASASHAQLMGFVERARSGGRKGPRSTAELTLIWNSLCSGLALREVCGGMPVDQAERIWREALTALWAGLQPEPPRP